MEAFEMKEARAMGPQLLRDWRERNGLSQEAMAEDFGRSRQQINAIERGYGVGLRFAIAIEEYTGGEVKAKDWLTPKKRIRIRWKNHKPSA